MTFKERFYACTGCDHRQRVFAWDTDPAPDCHGPMVETGHVLAYGRNRGVIDDQIEGGPRFFETMGHEPVWIESKSQWRREMDKRNLQNVVRHDAAYYARQRKQHDERLRDEGRRY